MFTGPVRPLTACAAVAVAALPLLLASCGGGEEVDTGVAVAVSALDEEITDDAETGTGAEGETDGSTTTTEAEVEVDGETEGTDPTMVDPAAGSVRVPLGDERPDVIPTSFWAIEDTTFDLVRVASSDGAVLDRLGGWGEAAAAGDAPQLLTSVEATTDGRLWLDDCCEPAIGTSYLVDDDQSFDLIAAPGAVTSRNGLSPEVNASGDRVALSLLDLGVLVADGVTGAEIAGPVAVKQAVATAVVGDPDGFLNPFPVAWHGSSTVAVGWPRIGGDAVQAVNVSGAAPVAVGPAITVGGAIVAGDVRTDGALVVAVIRDGTEGRAAAVAGEVYDPDTGELLAEFALPPETIGVDYDPTGTYLLTVDADGTVTWFGQGRSGQLAEGYVAVSW
ncbi:MAG: hypothetical protein AAGE88_00925 [Actinomycetota bacterium]